MDSHQARFILQSYRGDERDAADPQFADALRVAESDPALAAWLAEEIERDQAIRRKVREFPVPDGLRERILSRRQIIRPEPAFFSRPWMAAAAAVTLLAAVAAVWLGQGRGGADFASYREQMVGILQGPMRLDYRNDQLTAVGQWLEQHDAPVAATIPAGLQADSDVGCRKLSWHGRAVALMCFVGRGDKAVHLFIAPRSALPAAPDGSEPQFVSIGGWNTISWVRDDTVYLLAGRVDEAALRKLL